MQQYAYMPARDILLICSETVSVSDPRWTLKKQRCFIKTRNEEFGEILAGWLASKGIKFSKKLSVPGMSIVTGKRVYEIDFELGQPDAETLDETVIQMSKDEDYMFGLNASLRSGAHYEENAQTFTNKKNALEQLKQIIVEYSNDITSHDGGKYFYFYCNNDKNIDKAKELFATLDMYVEPYVSHLDGKEQTVLRYSATMIPGYAIQITEQLRNAIKERKHKSASAQLDQIMAESEKKGIEELKKNILSIKRIRYSMHSDPTHYYFYFRDIDRARNLMIELGVFDIEKYIDNHETPVLRLAIQDVNPISQWIITELQREIAVRGISKQHNAGGRSAI